MQSKQLSLGNFKIDAAVDGDGHLTLIIKSADGTPPVDMEDDVGCGTGEVGYRFTTDRIETAHFVS